MDKWWRNIKRLISREENKSADQPFIHEMIDLEDFEINEYLEWTGGDHLPLLKKRLQQAYFNYITGGDVTDHSFAFFDTPQSKGFAIFPHYESSWKDSDYRFFKHYISSRLSNENYIINLADVRSRQKSVWIESIFRYYMKPSPKMRAQSPVNQLYGNVNMEYIKRDDQPYMFRLLANAYQDNHFKPVKPFGELMKLITS
ncbi:MAG TPA: hypothetical protein PKC30_00245 [Saprospiraceae bacterium]|nr:hypothetical protein [Saprospiraceae bacterium]